MAELEFDERPWGNYLVLLDEIDCKVKRLVVEPGKRLSLQRHARRSEHWFIVSGIGVVTLDEERRPVAPGDAIDVAAGVAHRIECLGPDELVFIEVQHGEYFGEDDIVRLEDDFGRIG
jgi:mannose-6-phosphate isomerase-like protein (cupin superfamily)